MLKLHSCPRNHFWEAEADGAACPECGAPAESLPLIDLQPTAAPPAPAAPPPAPAVLLFDADGRPFVTGYEVQEALGKTPAGVALYRARQDITKRAVLLKVVAAKEDAGQRGWNSLRGEASALGKLQSPHVVTILEAGERERQLFYNVLEYVDGPNLRRMAAERPLPVGQGVRLVIALAWAVEHAHGRGVVHRNLKPTSVLLQPVRPHKGGPADGEGPDGCCLLHATWCLPRITDWGLARRPVEGDVNDLELFGDAPGYLAPEQAWGRARDLGPATDVYGLGGVLYFLLTGRAPFEAADAAEAIDLVQSHRLVPPRRLRPDVHEDLDAVCRKALAAAPHRRYEGARELALDLGRYAAGLPVQARPVGAAARLGKWARRRPAVATLLIALCLSVFGFLLALAGGGGAGAEHDRTLLDNEALQNQLSRAWSDLHRYQRQEQFANYRRLLGRAQQELKAGRMEGVRERLTACPPEHRHMEWYHLERVLDRAEPLRVGNFDHGLRSLTFSRADGTCLAAVGVEARRAVVHVWDYPDKFERLTLVPADLPAVVGAAALSPTEEHVAVTGTANDGAGEVRVIDFQKGVARGDQLFRQTFPGQAVTAVAYTPDGAALLVLQGNGQVTRVNAHTGDDALPFDRADGRDRATTLLAVSPDGRLAATAHDDGIQLYSVPTGGLLNTLPRPARALAFLEANRLAFARTDHSIGVWDLARNEELYTLAGHTAAVTHLAVSPDGQRLASASEDGTVRVWGHAGGEWAELLTLERAPAPGGVAFTPAGFGLATADRRTVTVWGRPE